MDAWTERRFLPCVSTALTLEYEDVLVRKVGRERRESALQALQALLVRSEHVLIHFTYCPSSPDPSDDLVVDCVLNGHALLVTENVADFKKPARELGFRVVRPRRFLEILEEVEA